MLFLSLVRGDFYTELHRALHRALSAIRNNVVFVFKGNIVQVAWGESVCIIKVSAFQGCSQGGLHCIEYDKVHGELLQLEGVSITVHMHDIDKILIHYCICTIALDPTHPPCPLYKNTAIIEQPVDLVTLHDKYANAATNFIRRESGKNGTYLVKIMTVIVNC